MDFSNIKVLVVGDFCLDIFTNGESSRLAPEAPVPVIKNFKSKYSLGMAGNVAINLKNLGADVTIESLYGDDYNANIIDDLLDSNKIRHFNNIINNYGNKFRTITKERILVNGKQIVRLDQECFPEDNINMAQQITEIMNRNYKINEFDFIIISDYNKGFITKENWKYFRPVLEKINKTGLFFVDTKKEDVLMYEGMILFPNSNELKNMLKSNNCLNTNHLMTELDTNLLIETASENGAYAYIKDENNLNFNIIHEKSQVKEAIDVYGAGDVFISAFSLYYYKTRNYIRALKFANYCCSKTIIKLGPTPISLHEISTFDLMFGGN
jgi:rfaE bifunctional protein kinase chain/domain